MLDHICSDECAERYVAMFDWLRKWHDEPTDKPPEGADTHSQQAAHSGAGNDTLWRPQPTAFQPPDGGGSNNGGNTRNSGGDGSVSGPTPQTIGDILSDQRGSGRDDPNQTVLTPGRLPPKTAGARIDSTQVTRDSVTAGQTNPAIQSQQPASSIPFRQASAVQAPSAAPTPSQPTAPASRGASIPLPPPGAIQLPNTQPNSSSKISRFSPHRSGAGLSIPSGAPGNIPGNNMGFRVAPPMVAPGLPQAGPLRDTGPNGVEEGIRKLVLAILSQQQLVANLPDRMVQALRLLLAPRPSQAEIREGMAA